MTTKISEANIQATTLGALGGGGPKISSIIVTDSSYNNLDDTAVALGGGYIKLIGEDFAAGCQVLIGLTPVTSVTFISDTEVRAQVPATAAGTYIVYLVNADGGTAIRVNALTFSGTPTWVTGSALGGADGVGISIQLSATGAATFALAAGSTLPPGVSLSSSGLLSGTVTGISQETVYNFIINAVDAELQDSPRSFAFTVTSGDLLFASTTLLLPGSATTFVRDASTNNFAVTVAGDTRPNSFNPFTLSSSYSTYGSGYFDGTGDYLTVGSNSALSFGTADFTVECWAYFTLLSGNIILFDRWTSGDLTGWQLYYRSSGTSISWYDNGVVQLQDPSPSRITVNQWYHIAVSRSGTTLRMFINGALVASTTNSTSLTNSNTLGIGAQVTTITNLFTGYISNLRLVKGTAVYTSAFTPSTTPLTAVSGTSLLTLQNNTPVANNTFLDSSSNNLLVTRVGNATQGSFSPYSPSGWSNYFDGNGDYFTVAANTAFDFGTGDFTIEAWVNPISNGLNFPTFLGSVTGWSAGASGHRFNNVGYANKFWFGLNGSGGIASGDPFMTSTNTFGFNTWYHYAVTRSGNTFRMFVNGALENTQTFSGSYNAGLGGLRSGWSTWDAAQGYFTGSVSNLRLIKGTALYTTAFTSPTQPLTAVSNTSLLTCADNRFVDESTNNFAITRVGDVRVQNFSPFKAVVQTPVTYSAYFDGSGDYLTVPASTNFQFPGDFTIEGWMYFTNTAGTSPQALFSVVSGSTEFDIRWFTTRWQVSLNAGSGTNIGTAPAPVNNTWTHVACVRSGSTISLYVNGVATGTTITNSSTLGQAASAASVAASNSGGNIFTGYISNVRVVKGTALYTANFTPSTTPLTAITGTSLLTCQSPTFVDNSTNLSTITALGNSQPSTVNPFGSAFVNSAGYSAADHSGSMYFDGNGDRVTIPYTAVLSQQTAYTLEFWFYPTYNFTGQYLFARNAGGYFALAWNGTSGIISVDKHGVGVQITGTTALGLNAWHHVAMTYNGTTTRLFANGILQGSVSGTGGESSADTIIGYYAAATSSSYGGYISNFRMVRGTALYTSNFVPPVAPVQPVQNTVLLLNGTSAAITDTTTKNVLETVGDVKVSTAVSKFGGSSMFFDGTGDWIQVSGTNPILAFGTGAFTVEFWFYSLAASGTQQLFDTRPAGTGSTSGYMALTYSGSLNYYTAGGNPIAGGAVSANAWHHVALTRSGTSTRMFVDGVQVGSTYADTNTYLNGANRPIIGADGNAPSASLTGYIQDFRITKSVARYTANFTPPAEPLQTR